MYVDYYSLANDLHKLIRLDFAVVQGIYRRNTWVLKCEILYNDATTFRMHNE